MKMAGSSEEAWKGTSWNIGDSGGRIDVEHCVTKSQLCITVNHGSLIKKKKKNPPSTWP